MDAEQAVKAVTEWLEVVRNSMLLRVKLGDAGAQADADRAQCAIDLIEQMQSGLDLTEKANRRVLEENRLLRARIKELERERDNAEAPACPSLQQELAEAYNLIKELEGRAKGWRERDWPEGFDRRTAELMAEWLTE